MGKSSFKNWTDLIDFLVTKHSLESDGPKNKRGEQQVDVSVAYFHGKKGSFNSGIDVMQKNY